MKRLREIAPASALLLVLTACAQLPSLPDDAVRCVEPRPQVCTMDYRPVCATRDNGTRCVTTPCDSTETATYANGCGACADPAVIAWVPGACPE